MQMPTRNRLAGPHRLSNDRIFILPAERTTGQKKWLLAEKMFTFLAEDADKGRLVRALSLFF